MLILVCSSAFIYAQDKLEIVILASSHDNSNSAENFRQIIDRLKKFKPDMVFGEYLSGPELKQLEPTNFGSKTFKPIAQFIDRHQPVTPKNLDAAIAKTRKALSKFAYYHQSRMDLAVNYIKNSDRGNGEYQIFVLENYMKKAFGKKEQAYYEQLFGNLDSLKKGRLWRPNSEYHKIYFPLIYELNQDYIYPMDCQKYDGPWSEAWSKVADIVKKMEAKAKADSLSPEARTLKAIDKYAAYTSEEEKAFNKAPYAMMNMPKYAELDACWNFYGGPHFYGYPGYPTEAVKAMIVQWTNRNEGMCENIIRQAKEKKAKRIVVGVGASHRKWMEEILNKRNDVVIVNYNDLQD